jgi:hypothetical protein
MRRICSAGAGLLLVLLAGGTSEGASPPAVVGLLLDTSGSLRTADLDRARGLTAELMKALPEGSEVAVFTFDDQSRLVLPHTSDPAAVARAVSGAKIRGQWTALNDALYDASRYLKEIPASRRAIVLVTDGLDENSVLNVEDALAIASASRIPIYSVGVGRVQERFLQRVAKLTSGQYIPGTSARGGDIAALIAGLPLEAAPSAPGPSEGPHAATTPAPQAPQGAPPRPGSRVWISALVLLVLLLGAAALLLRSPSQAPRCPTCGSELTGPFAACAFCARADEAEEDDREGEGDAAHSTLPPTLLAKLDGTEEFLEKTVTLRENLVLAITKGSGVGQSYSLSRESITSLGRAKANDIVLNDVAVSSQHCRIRPEEGRFVLHDLRSTNGTFVNERKVSRCALSEGDTIKIGETLLQFRTDQRRL